MTGHDRDRQLDLHLRRAFKSGPLEPSADCLDAESMAAWLDGGLDASTAAKAEAHVSSCARCQAMVGVMAQTAPVDAPATPAWWKGWMGWLVPLAATAAAVGVWMVVPNPPRPAQPTEAPAASQALGRRDNLAPRDEARVAQAPAELDRRASEEPAAQPAAEPSRLRAQAPAAGALKDQATTAKVDEQKLATAASNESALAKREDAGKPAAMAELAAPAAPAPAAAPPAAQALGRALRQKTGAWQQLAAAQGIEVTAFASPSSTVCWTIGPRGAVWLSTDGSSFRRLAFPEPIDLARIEATDARTAAITATDGRVFRTADGGATWR